MNDRLHAGRFATAPPPEGVGTIGTRVAERLAGFPAFLRANGFAVGADAVPTLRTAQHGGVLQSDLLRWSLQALLCGRADEWRRFDDLFDAWFLPANRWQQPVARDAQRRPSGLQADTAGDDASTVTDDHDAARPPHVASREQALGSADFRTLTAREHTIDIEALMREFARRIRQMQLRRTRRSDRGRRLDLPATIRRSVASGGTPVHLAWRQRRRVQPRLVLLMDVSRSMSQTSFFYLRLARALAAERSDVHSFIFHTHTTAVSRVTADGETRPGNPVIFDAALRDEWLAGASDAACRKWRASHPERVRWFDTDNRRYALDVDTPDDLEHFAARTGHTLQWPAPFAHEMAK